MDQGYCSGDDVLVEEEWVVTKLTEEAESWSFIMRLSDVKKFGIVTERRGERK
jgi:hypothetical protein